MLLHLNPSNKNSNEAKIRVIYDYASQNEELVEADLIKITTNLTINTAPHSEITINYKYNGQSFNEIERYDLTIPPEKWPKADTWLNEDWNAVEHLYSKIVEK